MGKLKALQEKYKKGEITKAQYATELKTLLDGEFIEQDSYDDALEFDPEAEKAIFTQADVDRMVASKAVKMVRKALKDAGVEVDADNKTLLSTVADLAKAGTGKEPAKADDKEVAALRKAVEAAGGHAALIKDLKIENAVLKESGKYDPVSANQVARALRLDYMGLVAFDDETGEIDLKSVDRAVRRIKEAEPNLFKEGADEGNQPGSGFSGKPPGGGAAGSGTDKAYDRNKAEAKGMLQNLGFLPKETAK